MSTARIAWIGTGVMGASQAGHLLKAGHPLTVYNRNKAKAQPLLDNGAAWAHTPKEAAVNADVVFTMVGYPHDVEAVTLGPEGVLQSMKPGAIVVDMTTSSPALAVRIAAEAAKKGCAAVDAPVTGGDHGAREAMLTIFCGCDKATFDIVEPVLRLMGKNVILCGNAGAGHCAKLANQVAVAGLMASVCESLLFAQEAGIDVNQWLDVVVQGAAGSAAMKVMGRKAVKNDYAAGFYVEHILKDLSLCMDECRRMNLVLPALAVMEQAYRTLVARGKGRDGTQILVKELAAASGKVWRGGV